MEKFKKKILIVEDENSILRLFVNELTRHSFECLEARNGQKGLELALKEHPDLILLDLVMPKMDGMTMLEKLRSDTWGRTVPVMIFTNLINNSTESAAADCGVVDFIVKTDLKLERLVRSMKKVLKVSFLHVLQSHLGQMALRCNQRFRAFLVAFVVPAKSQEQLKK